MDIKTKKSKKKLDAATEAAVAAGGLPFEFDAIYLVNLDDKPKRWKLFSKLEVLFGKISLG